MRNISDEKTANLQKNIEGRIVLPKDPNYDEVRQLWNAMIDRHPAIIVQCTNPEDVRQALSFARANNLEISVRGAGHNIAGNSLCDDGLVIDLSPMKKVRVDEKQKRAYVEPGATLADVDGETQKYGLATPLGINSTTGISGLTLGGGFGWLTRQYGMTVDNLLSAEVVTADGKKVTASDNGTADLFWAVRGGGGNFGIVTRFEFQLHPVGPDVLAGFIVFPLKQAKQVLQKFREFVPSAPEELNIIMVMRQAPPLPFLPEEVHGQEILIMAVFDNGDQNQGNKYLEMFRKFGTPVGEHTGVMPYVQWQKVLDPLLAPGARNYWKSHNLQRISDEFMDTLINYARKFPSPHCEILLVLMEGQANRIPTDDMAYGNRGTRFLMNVHGRWEDAENDDKCIKWARELFRATSPFESDGVYVNFMSEDDMSRIQAAYGSNYERLVQIKRKYDPENIFHVNHNIVP